MADAQTIQVSHMLDERGIGAFHIKLLIWSLFIVLIDGYDIGAIAFAAPSLMKQWHFPPSQLGPIFSASLIGILFGSAIFGFVGDRYGRKAALIGANLVFGIFTLIAAYSTNVSEMFWLRMLAGLGIGGVIPNAIAINAESAPRHLRATLAIIAVGLVPIGGAIPGFLTVAFVPTYGWQFLFFVGGIVPILIGICGIFGLPESIKYMALHEKHRADMEKLVHAIQPDFVIPPNAKFVIEDEHNYGAFRPSLLFQDGLALITPLVWLLFMLNLMGFFFLNSWTPTLLVTAAHLPPAVGALTGAIFQVGGTVGALLLCRWIDKRRFGAIAILFVIAVPVVGSIGWFGITSQTSLMIAAFFGGFLVLGIQSGINVSGALIYPTSLRSNGSGWQLGIGRIGSIVGPMLGAFFVALPVQQLYMWAALPFALGAVLCFVVYRLNATRLRERPWAREGQAAAAE
ncbi:MAG TPA: MFS transporter [Stellaceae bacterium]|nr:MFS transporter [Stellaceae bacterium]